MTVQRMDNVGVVVDDLAAVTAFFVALGLELEGEATVGGPEVDLLVGLEGVRCEMAVVRTPDGHGRLELMKFHAPAAPAAADRDAPVNAFGMRRIMFAVEADGEVHPGSLDRRLALQLETQRLEEGDRRREVVDDDADVVQPLNAHRRRR